ncbi:MAG: LysR substrate-binding domain-containing protein [Pseudomonadota bacterium]
MEKPANLPKSLDALRVFEAAARRMSFTEAAEELLVTQAAVSRRIAALEAQVGFALFERSGRRLALTAKGEALRGRVRAALDYLDESFEALGAGARPAAVTIAASGSVSHLWLGERLRDYARAGGTEAVRLLTTDDLGEAAAEANDLAVLYAASADHPRWTLTPLLPEALAPVAAPAHLAARGLSAADLPLPLERLGALDLLDYDRVRPQWITLERWFARAGAAMPGRPVRVFSTYFMAVEAALAGDGVILGSLALLAPWLARGDLLRLTSETDETGCAYHLGVKKGREAPEAARRLHDWLTASAGGADGAGPFSQRSSDQRSRGLAPRGKETLL